MVLSRPEYMAMGDCFAASHSVSAEEQARIDHGLAPVLWPDAPAPWIFIMSTMSHPQSLPRVVGIIMSTSPTTLSPAGTEAMMPLQETYRQRCDRGGS